MLKHLVFAFVIAALPSCGRNEPLANYEPKSPREQALKNLLLEFEDGINARDAVKVGNLIHNEASIMIGRDRKILSRAGYIAILPKRLAENPPISLGIPKMSVFDYKAEVRIYMTRGDYTGLMVFNMKLDNDRWYIQSWDY